MDVYTVAMVIYIHIVAMVMVIVTMLIDAMVNSDDVARVIVAMATYSYLMLHFVWITWFQRFGDFMYLISLKTS